LITQDTVRHWFDEVYATKGLEYLRPPQAYPVFVDLLHAKPGEALLDIACGPGLLLRAASEYGLRAYGVDLSTVAVSMRSRVAPAARAMVGNAERLPFADGSFDLITCIGSLERMLDRDGVLREMQRVTRPGARFCLMVRNSRTLKWKLHAELLGRRNIKGHQDAAGLEQWSELFERLGFIVDGVYPDQWFAQRMRRALGWSWEAQQGKITTSYLLPIRYANEFIYVMRKRA